MAFAMLISLHRFCTRQDTKGCGFGLAADIVWGFNVCRRLLPQAGAATYLVHDRQHILYIFV
jgi:hypothetical protein